MCIQTNIEEEEEEGRLSHKCQPAFIAPPLFSPDRGPLPLANRTLPHLSNFLSFSIALSSFCWYSGGNCMRSILVSELLRLPHSSNTWSKIIGFTQWAACFIQIWTASHQPNLLWLEIEKTIWDKDLSMWLQYTQRWQKTFCTYISSHLMMMLMRSEMLMQLKHTWFCLGRSVRKTLAVWGNDHQSP